jgi:medium-chain acyl-[acyl-carrier-protein] hydrolase
VSPASWTESIVVRVLDTDAAGLLAVDSLCDFLQEAAGGHVRALGVSVGDLLPRNLTWVLSRLRLRIDRLPRRGERVEVTTWPSGVDRLFALRDFRLVDERGERVAGAVTGWLLVDLASRRPLRTRTVFDPTLGTDIPRVLDCGIEKLGALAAVDRETPFGVRLRDLDENDHVNNARIAGWVAESVGRETWQGWSVAALDIDFVSEIRHGDHLLARAAREAEGRWSHSLVREGDGVELVRARSEWRPRA